MSSLLTGFLLIVRFIVGSISLLLLLIWIARVYVDAYRYRIIASAKAISAVTWYVKDIDIKPHQTVLLIQNTSRERMEYVIPFRPLHPNLSLVSGLQHSDIIEFDFQEKPFKESYSYELCAYLRVKFLGNNFA